MTTPLTPSDTPHADGSHPPVPGYEIVGEVGKGAFGRVYKARHEKLNRIVAIKVPAGGRDDEAGARLLEHEARILAELQHPGIVQLYEFGEDQGRPFEVQEFAEGGDLAGEIGRAGPLTTDRAVALLARLAEAVGYLHGKGIIHRDLKPANVLLTRGHDAEAGPPGTPKLTGFEIALRSGVDQEVSIAGTPVYMAPEQWHGQTAQLGPATDLWALGVLFYEAITGQRPFASTPVAKIMAQVTKGEYTPPRTLRPDLPSAVDAICARCLRPDPKERFASAAELLDALGRAFPAGADSSRSGKHPPGSFPYETLLGYLKGELDAAGVEQVRSHLRTDPRWRAHHDSARYLSLERVAARQDGRDLQKFSCGQITSFCRVVARTDGEVLLPLIRKEEEVAAGHGREAWDKHVDRCVFCRRMRRLTQARVIRETHGVPADEPLLRDWLLAQHYREPLARLARRLREGPEEPPGEWTSQLKRDPNRFIDRLEPVVALMLERTLGEAQYASAFLSFLRKPAIKEQLAQAEHVRDVLGGVLADFCRLNRLPRGEDAREYLTREVMDNILWQAATAEQQRFAHPAERVPLEEVRRVLQDQLLAHQESAPNAAVERVLTRMCPEGREGKRLYGRLEQLFQSLRR